MVKGGWDKQLNISKFPQDILETIFLWQDLNSRHQKVHIAINGEETSLCNNSEYNPQTSQLEESTTKKRICLNCLRIASGLDANKTRDYTVKNAKKTLNRNSENSAKHKRLAAHHKALSKTPDDFRAALEKTKNNTITLQSEVTNHEESLRESLAITAATLTATRQSAVLNLERVMQSWKKCKAVDTFTIIQEGQKIKDLIQAVDVIKGFKL